MGVPIARTRAETRHARYARTLFVSDGVVVCLTVVASTLACLAGRSDAGDFPWAGSPILGYVVFSVGVAVLWMAALALSGSRSRRLAGRGVEEYANIVLSTLQAFGLTAIINLLLGVGVPRAYLAIALPVGIVGLMFNRRYWRRVGERRRRNGKDLTSVLVVGNPQSARDMARSFAMTPEAGYRVAGVCTPNGPVAHAGAIVVEDREVPVVGIDHAVVDAVHRTGAEVVAIAATDHLRPTEIRQLMWDLEPLGVDLMIAPGLVDVADERLYSRPIGGMAMLEIGKPQYSRANSLAKRTFDVLFTVAALIVSAPLMLAAALAVKISSPGPVFYTAERIGLNGVTFRMYKFRSMFEGADQKVAEMIAADGGNPLFFKSKDDPRVTPVGRLLRKFSIDELPQFFNVLRGDMSVVGPRPQVRREVESYDELVRRRLAVKPGLTGLWQVSGRSDLRIEDAVRLDLSYVENWSPVQDLVIIAKTVKTVLRGEGAY